MRYRNILVMHVHDYIELHLLLLFVYIIEFVVQYTRYLLNVGYFILNFIDYWMEIYTSKKSLNNDKYLLQKEKHI